MIVYSGFVSIRKQTSEKSSGFNYFLNMKSMYIIVKVALFKSVSQELSFVRWMFGENITLNNLNFVIFVCADASEGSPFSLSQVVISFITNRIKFRNAQMKAQSFFFPSVMHTLWILLIYVI